MSSAITIPALEWTEKLIKEIGIVTVGGTPRTEIARFWGGDIPWMVSGDVHLKRVLDVPGRITDLGLRHSNATLVEPSAIAIALAGQGKTRGTVALILTKLSTNQSIALIRTKDGIAATEYVFYDLEYRYEELRSRSAGDGRAGLSKALIEEVPVRLPSYCEQVKISEVLASIDMAIAQTEALIDKQQRIKKGLMQDLLTRGVDSHGSLRSESTHEFKNSPLGRIPVEWDFRSLAESTSSLITYGIVQPGANTPDGVPFIQTKNLKQGVLNPDELDRTSQTIHAAYKRSAVHAGDVIVGIRASVGSIVVVPHGAGEMNISRGVARLSPSTDLRGAFLQWVMQSDAVQRAIGVETKGSTYAEITLPALRGILIPIPPESEQDKIAGLLDSAASALTRHESELDKLVSLKRGLMTDLLTARTRVTALLELETTT